jgi:LPPG:FO 2-phospho-L-lactate transferase
MAAQGFEVSIAGVADCYRDFLDVLVADSSDAAAAQQIHKGGMRVVCTRTIMRTAKDRIALARAALTAAKQPPSVEAAPEHP